MPGSGAILTIIGFSYHLVVLFATASDRILQFMVSWPASNIWVRKPPCSVRCGQPRHGKSFHRFGGLGRTDVGLLERALLETRKTSEELDNYRGDRPFGPRYHWAPRLITGYTLLQF